MIHRTAIFFAERLAMMNIIDKRRIPVYAFGMELLLSSAIELALLVLFSCIAGKMLFLIAYLFGFILLRTEAGGYHANSHIGCLMLFTALYLLALIVYPRLLPIKYFPMICACICLHLVIKYAPIETKNNPLSSKNYIRSRKFCIIHSMVNFLVAICFWLEYIDMMPVAVAYFSGITAACILMYIAVIKDKPKRRDLIENANP